MADNTDDNFVAEEISVAEETALLGDDDGNTESQEITMQGLAKLMTSMNENMAAVASSVALLGSNLKRPRDDSPDNSRPNKKQKTRNDPTCNDEQHSGDESDSSSHSDSAELRAIMAPKDKATTSTAESSICSACTALTQLAEILLTTPADTASLDLGKLVTMNADALALLGHATHQLSMHRRQAIKPFLNKEYATLCLPQGPVTEFLFGDELQAQLNNIKATNKIGNAMASEPPRQLAKGKEHWKNKTRGSFLGRRGGRLDRPLYRQKQWQKNKS